VNIDWANERDHRSSYMTLVKYGGFVIVWELKIQLTVVVSSTETEYIALAKAAKETACIKGFSDGLEEKCKLYCTVIIRGLTSCHVILCFIIGQSILTSDTISFVRV
jgi:hypothetical protein